MEAEVLEKLFALCIRPHCYAAGQGMVLFCAGVERMLEAANIQCTALRCPLVGAL